LILDVGLSEASCRITDVRYRMLDTVLDAIKGVMPKHQGRFFKKPDNHAAAVYFRMVLEHNPRQPQALLHLARYNYETGKVLQARGFMQRYFEVAMDTPEALLLAFRIERVLGDKNAQASFALRLRGKFPQSEEARQLRTLTGR